MREEKVQGSTLVEVAFEPCRQICMDLIREEGLAVLMEQHVWETASILFSWHSQCMEKSSDTARNTGEIQIQV